MKIIWGVWTRRKQWNFNQNKTIFIQENALQNTVCQMAAIVLALMC